MTSERLLLCRPQGGLNDVLCQIELACRYAERFDRTVVVQTDYRHSRYFKDALSNYFVSRQTQLILNAAEVADRLETADVIPACLAGRVNTYRTRWDPQLVRIVDDETGQPLSFDPTVDHPQRLIVQHASGGGGQGIGALSRMRLQDRLVDTLLERLRIIGPRYSGIHIRNTDYQSNYRDGLARLAPTIEGRVFVATDNRDCLDYCRSVLGADRVYSFSDLSTAGGQPLHRRETDAGAFAANRDAILDLLMLALSHHCIGFELAPNTYGVKYSGYSILAINLNVSKPQLARLLSRRDPLLEQMVWSVEA